MEHKPGMIAIPCNDLARYSVFALSLATTNMPVGTQLAMVRSMDVTANLNTIVREAMEGKADWVWFQGDDHVWMPDLLMELLDLNVDCVVPLVSKKNPPFNLVIFKDSWMATDQKDGREYRHYQYYEPGDLPDSGLIEVHAAGSAAMLVRRHVLEEIGDPWFENSVGTIVNDDLEFCQKIKALGYKVQCSTDHAMGHVSIHTVWPETRDGTRGISLDFGGKGENKIFMATDLNHLRDQARENYLQQVADAEAAKEKASA
jgi:hypothetical protein